MSILNWVVLLIAFFNLLDLSEEAKKWKNKCPKFDINHAHITIRQNRRIAKIRCNQGYTMFEGDKRLTCLKKKWFGRIPQCIKGGCDTESVDNFKNGDAIELYNGALLHFQCHLGFELQGNPAITCDGVNWNSSLPICEIPPEDPTHRTCHFETKDICSWHQDSMDSNDWLWSSAAQIAHVGFLGAKVDHTTGTNSGHYMHIDRLNNWQRGNTARLFSPILKVPDLTPGCISFWYHFHDVHQTEAQLNIYVLLLSIPFEMTPPSKVIDGSNTNDWKQTVVSLVDSEEENFQIVIEAHSTSGHIAPIAIDDFMVRSGDICIQLEIEEFLNNHAESTTDSISTTSAEISSKVQTPISTRSFRTDAPVTTTSLPEEVANITLIIGNPTVSPNYSRRTVVFETTKVLPTTRRKFFITTPLKPLFTFPIFTIPPYETHTLPRYTLKPQTTSYTQTSTANKLKETTSKKPATTVKKTTRTVKSTTSTTKIPFKFITTTKSTTKRTTVRPKTTKRTTTTTTIRSTTIKSQINSTPSVLTLKDQTSKSNVAILIIIGILGFIFVGGSIGFIWQKKIKITSLQSDDSDTRQLKEDEEMNCERDSQLPQLHTSSYRQLQNLSYPQEDDGTPV